jgi:RHS repeat-associated protein
LWGVPVAVFFSSPAVSTPDCGHNFIVPNHLGTPLRLIDQNGLVTQSPEPGPYGGIQQPFNMNNGQQFQDNLAVWDTATSSNVPYLSQAAITDPGPTATYSQSFTVPGANLLQIQIDTLDNMNWCTDSLTISGSGYGDPGETVTSGSGPYTSIQHVGETITVTLNFSGSACGGTCDCSSPHGNFNVVAATNIYAQDTNSISLGLPGQFSTFMGNQANWHRYFSEQPNMYMSPDPALRWRGIPAQFAAYAYAYTNPLLFVDPTGLGPDGGSSAAGGSSTNADGGGSSGGGACELECDIEGGQNPGELSCQDEFAASAHTICFTEDNQTVCVTRHTKSQAWLTQCLQTEASRVAECKAACNPQPVQQCLPDGGKYEWQK